jgi:3-deoxy-D-manno-octulosonate cytidylyltransferase
MSLNTKISVLDCTLRDGGYVNNWNFSNSQINEIAKSLEESNIDIIELGYLDEKRGGKENSTLFNTASSVSGILDSASTSLQKVVMIDLFSFDIDKLPEQTNTKIDGIRLAFHKKDITDALQAAKKITHLGYKLFFQPMVTKTYTDKEFLTLIEKVSQIDVYAFYIVDSFGSMSLSEFRHYIGLADTYLNKRVGLGYHSHNNMQLAFSNAIDLCTSNIDREVILDSSIYGMGRGAGNLNTELICDYLNNNNNKEYKVVPLLEVIDEILVFYFKQNSWGFSPAQYLSASLDCHPSYASYLIDKKTNHIADIKNVLEKIPLQNRVSFDGKIINDLYQQFLLTDKSNVQGKLNIPNGKKVLLIASGSSVNDNLGLIKQKVESSDYFVIALNHKPQFDCDYYFFSNQQRFDEFKGQLPIERQIITTNIKRNKKMDLVVGLKDIVYIENEFVTNVAILVINYLISKKVSSVEVAGLDGYQMGKSNYAYDETNVISNESLFKELNKIVSDSLYILKKSIDIKLITPSIYGENIPLRILGVIPARYNSSRFQGKPLCLINNVPMIKRTYDRVRKSELLDNLVVATDDLKIKEYCEKESIPVVMTSNKHLTGTDRLAEVAQKEYYDLYINIQGDEPIIDYHSINQIVDDYKKNSQSYAVYNLYKKITSKDEVGSNTIIKVVVNQNDELMYMSRHPIPFNKTTNKAVYNKQVCIYGFTKKALEVFSNRDKSHNEQFEDIELLRFLDLGYSVKMLETTVDSIAVDVPEDIKKVEDFLKKNNLP